MNFKNIHNRKDFIKKYEFFGGTSGGAGERDGFANNAKLKDTYLGKLMDGIFGGIRNLWRKSKEMFVINRLIAQLINELYRGIILFCFNNNIKLSTGEDLEKDDDVLGNDTFEDVYDDEGLESDFEEDEKSDDLEADFEKDEQDVQDEQDEENIKDNEIEDDLSKYSREELLEKIKRLTDGINEDIKVITDKEGQIKMDTYMINGNSYTIKEKENKQKNINKLKKEVIFLKKELVKSKKQLIKLKEALEKLESGENLKSKFSSLKIACKNKYGFSPKMRHLPVEPSEFVDIGAISVPELSEKLSTIKYNSEYIKIGQEFSIVDNNGKLFEITVWDVDNSTNEIIYNYNNSLKRVKDVRLLPKYFPKLRKPALACDDFLDKYISEYDTMDEDHKEKMETIYMQYKLISEINKIRRLSMIQESIDYVDLVLEKIVKIKTDNPKAGNVNPVRNTAIKSGLSSVNVGDILTKKDKEKYKEKSDIFKVSVKNINLPQIEKTIDELEKRDSSTKEKVSSYVNPYNLKTIQLSAEELLNKNNDKNNNSSLKLKWEKELSKTYAAFDGIMNMSKVDISNNNFGSSIQDSKIVKKSSEEMTKNISLQVDVNQMMEKLPLEYDSSNYSKMKKGDFTYYSFTYPDKTKLYNTSLSPVSSTFKDFGLVCVTSCFIDFEDGSVIEDPKFKINFISNRSDVTSSNNVNVYFLFKYNQRFPSRNKPRLTKMFVLNEYIIHDKSYLSIKSVKTGSKNLDITKSSVTNLNKNDYIFNIESISIHNFLANELDSIASKFNLIRSKDPKKNTDFRIGLPQPNFLTEDMIENIKKLSNKL